MFLDRGKIFHTKEQFQKRRVDLLRHSERTEVTFDEVHLWIYLIWALTTTATERVRPTFDRILLWQRLRSLSAVSIRYSLRVLYRGAAKVVRKSLCPCLTDGKIQTVLQSENSDRSSHQNQSETCGPFSSLWQRWGFGTVPFSWKFRSPQVWNGNV